MFEITSRSGQHLCQRRPVASCRPLTMMNNLRAVYKNGGCAGRLKQNVSTKTLELIRCRLKARRLEDGIQQFLCLHINSLKSQVMSGKSILRERERGKLGTRLNCWK